MAPVKVQLLPQGELLLLLAALLPVQSAISFALHEFTARVLLSLLYMLLLPLTRQAVRNIGHTTAGRGTRPAAVDTYLHPANHCCCPVRAACGLDAVLLTVQVCPVVML